jgi:hypothetical protein
MVQLQLRHLVYELRQINRPGLTTVKNIRSKFDIISHLILKR